MGGAETIAWERDDQGIVTLTLDLPDGAARPSTPSDLAALRATVERLEAEREAIAGVVVTAARPAFPAGEELRELVDERADAARRLAATIGEANALTRRLERLGRPVVAAIAGPALGGGLELALACHRRIAVADPANRIGLPEVTLGLMPGGGGIARTVRMLGVVAALRQVLVSGQELTPRAALDLGLVDELVGSPGELAEAARRWIGEAPEPAQPWDLPGFEIPGTEELSALLPGLPASLRRELGSERYAAPRRILAAAAEGAQVDFDTAVAIEARHMVAVATGTVARNMIRVNFFDRRRAEAAAGRASAESADRTGRAVVLGAGTMGAGIAYALARCGVEVVLKDVTAEAAARGRGYAERRLGRAVERGDLSGSEAEAVLARIVPTERTADAAGAELAVEAVFEDPDLKRRVIAEVEPHLADGALIATNTSSLPIGGLAAAVSRAADFIGMHFFSPVDRMPLLEIVKGPQTSDETLRRALALAARTSKVPVVVADRRGFFTTRVINVFLTESLRMLLEGIPPATIERAAQRAGYPMPPLRLSDDLNLRLMREVLDSARRGIALEGGHDWADGPALDVLDRMVDQLRRPGRLGGGGFYEYDEDGGSRLWAGLGEAFPPGAEPAAIAIDELAERMLAIEAIEASRALGEGVIASVSQANVASVLGIGYPAWTGGVLRYVDSYRGGPRGFVARARELADRHGERFAPPASLLELADRGERFPET